MTISYAEFLASKKRRAPVTGQPCDPAEVNPYLHPWQRDIVAWAVRKGRAALWEDTGLGKTVQQLEWARLSGARALIVAPLAVCRQTVVEAARLGIDARYVREHSHADDGCIRVTNYEMAEKFDPAALDAVVLDEASILKAHDGKTRTRLIRHFAGVPARLACTATPAPNDPAELTNQAEFLGVATRAEMLASYFIHDSDGWRLKGHARGPMFRWMSSWAVALRRPSDLGYPDDGYLLPGLDIRTHLISTGAGVQLDDALFPVPGPAAIKGVTGRAKVRKATIEARCGRAVELVRAEPDEPWLLWAGLNDEARILAEQLPGAVNVHGTMTPEAKADALLAFAAGDVPILVTKPSIAAFGMNWQHCARQAFVGLSDSYEAYYQCIRRSWRHGQRRDVVAHVVLTDAEQVIADNIARKQAQAAEWTAELVAAMNATQEVA